MRSLNRFGLALLVATSLIGCGGTDSVVTPRSAAASGSVTASVVPKELLRNDANSGLLGRYEYELTITNGLSESIWVIDPVLGPSFDVPDTNTVEVHFDIKEKPDDGFLLGNLWERPRLVEVESANSHVVTFRFENPITPNLQWPKIDPLDNTKLITEEPEVTLVSPIKLTVVVGYGTEEFDPEPVGGGYDGSQFHMMLDWQNRLTTKEVRITDP